MKRTTGVLLCGCSLLLGVVAGFLLSPIKYGLYIGNNNGSCGGPDTEPPKPPKPPEKPDAPSFRLL